MINIFCTSPDNGRPSAVQRHNGSALFHAKYHYTAWWVRILLRDLSSQKRYSLDHNSPQERVERQIPSRTSISLTELTERVQLRRLGPRLAIHRLNPRNLRQHAMKHPTQNQRG